MLLLPPVTLLLPLIYVVVTIVPTSHLVVVNALVGACAADDVAEVVGTAFAIVSTIVVAATPTSAASRY